MEKRENSNPMTVFNEAIALLLAGAFAVKTGVQIEDSSHTFQIIDKNIFGVGIFLLVAGFIIILNVYKFPLVTRLSDRVPRRARTLILLIVPFILFVVTISEYIVRVVEFASVPTIFLIGFALFIFVVVALIFTLLKGRKRIQDISALAFAFSFNIVAIYLIMNQYQDVRLIVILLAASAVVVLLTMIRISRRKERQLKLRL